MRKLTILIITILTLNIGYLSAQQKIDFKAKWEKGKTLTYYLFNNKYNPNNKDFKRNKDTIIVSFKVISAENNGAVIEMLYNYSKSTNNTALEGLKKVISIVKQTPIELQLDSNGKFQQVKNWQEVRLRCLAELASGKSKAAKNEKDIWDYWKTKVQTQEQLEKLFVDDIEYAFMLFGSNLVKNKAFDYEDEIIYQKAIMPANTHLTVTGDSLSKNSVNIKLHTLPDPKKAVNQLNQFRRMAKEQEDNPDSKPEISMFDLQDYYIFKYNTVNKNLEVATYLRYTRNGTKELVNEWFFKLLY